MANSFSSETDTTNLKLYLNKDQKVALNIAIRINFTSSPDEVAPLVLKGMIPTVCDGVLASTWIFIDSRNLSALFSKRYISTLSML
jgi:hypothetical protein